MIHELVEKHGVMKLSRACEVQHGTIWLWRANGCLPYQKGGMRIKRYEKALAKLEGVTVQQFRERAYAEYLEAKGKAA